MGKHGPCYHCGVTSTPLWRNGPPEKPILCNACGSRWRTKGSLVNYTPLHSRPESQEYENYKIPRATIMSIKHKGPNVLKRKQTHDNKKSKGISHDYKHGSFKTVDEDMSNRSSSGSAVSNVSESCLEYGYVDTSKLTGPAQSVAWDQTIPSRKRTCFNRPKQSQLEKLTRDLHTILHEQQYSHFSISSEEDLLFDSDEPMVSVEIGHGSVLIRHPSSIAQEEESEASSISVENKICLANDYYSRSPTSPLYVNKVGLENNKRPLGIGMRQEEVNTNRDKDSHEKLMILENHNSPLCHVDLKEIINYEVFTNNMTNEEQQQLLQFLPELDKQSLEKMFASSELEEGMFSFQKLLSEGVFDLSFSGEKAEDCETLKTLALNCSQKSTWVEQYSLLKEKEAKSCKKGFVMREGANVLAYGTPTNVKRSRDGHLRIGSGTKKTMKKSPSFVSLVENGGSCFTPRNLFSMVDEFQYMSENSQQDLLIDVPANNFFPEAELFYHNTPNSSSVYTHDFTNPNKAF